MINMLSVVSFGPLGTLMYRVSNYFHLLAPGLGPALSYIAEEDRRTGEQEDRRIGG